MWYAEAMANARRLGRHERVVSQIRDAVNELSLKAMAKYFKVKEQDCSAVIDCIKKHPDWDNEQVACEIDWTD